VILSKSVQIRPNVIGEIFDAHSKICLLDDVRHNVPRQYSSKTTSALEDGFVKRYRQLLCWIIHMPSYIKSSTKSKFCLHSVGSDTNYKLLLSLEKSRVVSVSHSDV